jgi:hypothetical protein
MNLRWYNPNGILVILKAKEDGNSSWEMEMEMKER